MIIGATLLILPLSNDLFVPFKELKEVWLRNKIFMGDDVIHSTL